MKIRDIALTSATFGTVLIALAGCGTEPGTASVTASFPHTASQADEYPAALLEGKLTIDKSENSYCPRLESEDGVSYLLVLPPTAEVTADAVKIGDQTMTVGDVSVGGGQMATDFDDAGCAALSPAWLVAP